MSDNAALMSEGESVNQGLTNTKPVTDLDDTAIAATSLKPAVDVDQIDSLMQLDDAQPDNSSLNQTVSDTNHTTEKEPNLSADTTALKVVNKAPNMVISKDPITMRLLELGNIALANQKLLTPEEDNANLYFQAALGREPNNTAALKGIEEIIRFYTGWALDKAKQGHNQSARQYLDSARFVDSASPLISQTQQEIKDWRNGVRAKPQVVKANQPKRLQNKFYLPQNLFSLSEALVIQKLQPIIDRIKKDQLNIEIFWPNDKEARLLYQIINSRIDTFRVRGMIYRRAQHMIEVKQG